MKELYKGYTIEYRNQEFGTESPREWENLGTLMLANNYLNETKAWVTEAARQGENVVETLESQYGEIAALLKVYKYEHGGVWYDTKSFYGRLPQGHARFDSCHTGYIWTTKEHAREWFGVKYITQKVKNKITECLKDEVEVFGKWANGDVLEFITYDSDGEIVDS